MLKSQTVLVVDEHEDSRIILRTMLTHVGCEVVEAASGRAALALAAGMRPFAVVIELDMRNLTGFETSMLLRLNAGWESVPIIAISGHPVEHEALQAGFVAFLRKPFHLEQLVNALRRASRPMSA